MTLFRCPKCGHTWNYRGSSQYDVCCPKCHRKVRRVACTLYSTPGEEIEAWAKDMVAVNRLQATVTRVHTETGEEVCISIPHEEEMIPTPYDEYLQDTLEVCTLEEVEDLLTYEPNETECEIWGITPEECTRALQEAAEILRKQSKCKKLEDAP